ncbi:MAG: enoyl-CoA hydratase-related protein [Pseudomonadota bacterium]
MNLVGPAFSAEIFYTGRLFNAQDALQMGLVNRVMPEATALSL